MISSKDTLERVLTAYDEHRITLVRGNFASWQSDSAVKKVATHIRQTDKKVSVLYLSNIEGYISRFESSKIYSKLIHCIK